MTQVEQVIAVVEYTVDSIDLANKSELELYTLNKACDNLELLVVEVTKVDDTSVCLADMIFWLQVINCKALANGEVYKYIDDTLDRLETN